jgi:hypothetical protein
MCLDFNNIYLCTPADSFEYLLIPAKLIPQEIIAAYTLLPLVTVGHVCIEVQKGIYGLPQSGTLAHQFPTCPLTDHGYHQTTFTPCIWEHVSRPIKFTLVANECGPQYMGDEHDNHIIDVLYQSYTVYIVALH